MRLRRMTMLVLPCAVVASLRLAYWTAASAPASDEADPATHAIPATPTLLSCGERSSTPGPPGEGIVVSPARCRLDEA
jgi:hypothetical protein